MTSRTSFTPAVTADSRSKARLVRQRDDLGQRGLAGSGRPPEDGRRQPICLDQAAQRLARSDKVLLADDLVERHGAAAVPPAVTGRGASARRRR